MEIPYLFFLVLFTYHIIKYNNMTYSPFGRRRGEEGRTEQKDGRNDG